MAQLTVAVLCAVVAIFTTRQCARYQLMGMPAGMAAMMAAMGTGLAAGYAAGMSPDLATATLIGVVAGGGHGLWLGRIWGPSPALEGVSGGIMGGLMGPMLSVMLLYNPTGLVLAAIIMLASQVLFSGAALYLAADAAGALPSAGWQRALGRLLGATAQPGGDYYAILGVSPEADPTEIAEAFLAESRRAANDSDRLAAARQALAVLTDPLRRAKHDVARLEAIACCPPPALSAKAITQAPPAQPRASRRAERRARQQEQVTTTRFGVQTRVLVLGAVALGFLMLRAAPEFTGWPAPGRSAAQATGSPETAAAGDVQSVALTLNYPNLQPQLLEVQKGRPVELTMSSFDPG